ncbi:MAG TPA: lactate racemase domain-containing protein [Pirellulales bacterium]|nr:lactate racemase domain-containing protein [Pirellulales bacterium]
MPVYPKMFRVRQKFEAPRVDDIPGTVKAELAKLGLEKKVKPGQTVAITAGSRGIANIRHIIKAAVEHFQSIGAKPYIVPAMGSHGGGTAEGQRGILAGYGITEEFCGCPIKASMETIIVCQTAEGFPVHFDRRASEADHVLVCGRVKPHTDFVGDVESGLMKMMLIGLGKHEGAKVYHRAILDYSFPQIVKSVANRVLETCPILAGLAIVENGYDETAKIAAVPADSMEAHERELLVLAKKWMPKLPFDRCDILLIDELGKNISGAGVDTNVVGRKHRYHEAASDEFPKVRRIVIRGLTEETHGNASGIGLFEFCTTRAMQAIDERITRINCLTSGNVSAAMMPVNFDTDREIIDAALPTIGLTEPPNAKILWIRNTLELSEVECSQAYWDEAQKRSDLEILGDLHELPFDAKGDLPRYVFSRSH